MVWSRFTRQRWVVVYWLFCFLPFKDFISTLYTWLRNINPQIVIFSQTGEIVRQFSVLPLNRHTGNPLELRPDPHTGQYAPVIKQASFDKVGKISFSSLICRNCTCTNVFRWVLSLIAFLNSFILRRFLDAKPVDRNFAGPVSTVLEPQRRQPIDSSLSTALFHHTRASVCEFAEINQLHELRNPVFRHGQACEKASFDRHGARPFVWVSRITKPG